MVVASKSPVEDVPVVTLIRTDTTLDHSQEAEKVCCGQCLPYTLNVYQMHWCVYLLGHWKRHCPFRKGGVTWLTQVWYNFHCMQLRVIFSSAQLIFKTLYCRAQLIQSVLARSLGSYWDLHQTILWGTHTLTQTVVCPSWGSHAHD